MIASEAAAAGDVQPVAKKAKNTTLGRDQLLDKANNLALDNNKKDIKIGRLESKVEKLEAKVATLEGLTQT
eukprot:1982291-Rhodomonas_salina.1